jgi:hypothetical protein
LLPLPGGTWPATVPLDEDVILEVTDGRGRAVQAALPIQAYRIRLGQIEQRNAARGHAGEMEAVRRRASEAMTSRRFPVPWRADKIPGGYVVRDANGHALAYICSRDSEAEALQAKVPTKDEARRIAVNFARLPDLLGKTDRD